MAKPTPEVAVSCADARDPSETPVDVALGRILEAVRPLAASERVALRDALGRVLAAPVVANLDVPGHTNAAMDGYALRAVDLDDAATLRVIGEAYAGHPYPGAVGPGECVRIMTGAPMPAGTDTVLIQEHADHRGDSVSPARELKPGSNVRAAGEDLRAGEEILPAGRVVTPADLGLLASVGIGEVDVLRRPRVAFFSTGDELRPVGSTLELGQIHDSNRYTLHGMLQRLNVQTLDLGVVPDDPDRLRASLARAAAESDVVITSGGVSVGTADYIKGLLAELGEASFWKIAMKPGRPLTFGRIGGALFFGLPGNPVAVMVTFYQFVQPALLALATGTARPPLTVPAVSDERLRKRPGRTEYQRGHLYNDEQGRLRVSSTGSQGSGILRSMSEANCFIVIAEDSGPVEAGSEVLVQPFDSLV